MEEKIDIVSETKTLLDEIKKERELNEEYLKKITEVRNEQIKSGTSEGNKNLQPPVETPQEYTKRILSGKYEK